MIRNTIFIKLLLVVTYFLLLFPTIENKIFSVHFVDESDNFVSGKYLLGGEKLYKNLFTQHQPLPMIISSGIQKAVPINSIALLIKRHREFIFVYSFLWALALVFTSGFWTLGIIATLEFTKHFFYGNLFLAESLAVYPLIFLALIILGKCHPDQTKCVEGSSSLFLKIPRLPASWRVARDDVILGFLFSFITLLLLPLGPLLGFLFVIFLMRSRNKFGMTIFHFLLGFLPLLIFVTFFISWPKYFYDVFLTMKYYPEKINPAGVFMPFIPFFWKNIHSPVLKVIQSLSAIYLMIISVLIWRKKYLLSLLSFIILVLSAFRFVDLEKSFFNGFHMLPWFGVLITLIFYLPQIFLKRMPVLNLFYLIIIPFLIFLTGKNYYLVKTDSPADLYVNFSRKFDFGEAVNIMKNGNDRLFVVPDDYLIYWQSGSKHFDSTTSYYPWMEKIPELSAEINFLFITDPPEFLYCDCTNLTLKKYLDKYNRMSKDGKETDLYILKEKFKEKTTEQKDKLMYYNFIIREQ